MMEELLYHYTAKEFLEAILSSDTFLLSDFANANDEKEKADFVKSVGYKYASFVKHDFCVYNFSNPVMWRYYAKRIPGIKGVCIAVDHDSINKDIIEREGKIMYRNGVSYIDKQISENDKLSYLMCKSEPWSYENEYRIIFKKGIEKIESFNKCIREIYFDVDMESGEIRDFIERFSHVLSECSFYRICVDVYDGRFNRVKIQL